MIKIEYIKNSFEKKPDIEKIIEAFNDYSFNPNDTLIFGQVNENDFLQQIIAEEKLLFRTESYFYKNYLKIKLLINQLNNDKYNFMENKQNIFFVLRTSNIFIPNDFLEKIDKNFNILIENFTIKEQEVLQEYRKTDRLFYFGFESESTISRNNLVAEFWQNYFINKIKPSEVLYILTYNKKKYEKVLNEGLILIKEDWLVDYKNEIFNFPITEKITKLFNLDEQEQEILKYMFLEKELTIVSYLVGQKFKATPNEKETKIDTFVKGLSILYNLNLLSIKRFLCKSIFINNKIFKDPKDLSYYAGGPLNIYSIWGEKSFFNLKENITLEELISFYLPFSKNDNQLKLEDFSHLSKEINYLSKSLSQEKPKDILIWGPPGFGKTQIVKFLTKHHNLGIMEVVKSKVDNQSRFNLIETAKSVKSMTSAFCLLIDEAEDILKGKDEKSILTLELENKKVHSFWIVNSLEDIPEAYLRRFDYILEISEMPFSLRVCLANRLLNEKNNINEALAYKIAQAIHSPAEIKSTIDWCHTTQDYSWHNISSKVFAYQKALSKSIKNELGNFTIEVIPPERTNALDDFAGYHYIKEEARDILNIFSHPEKYSKVGAKVPKGILLAGPPGVGKTMFTRCLANELSITIITADSSALAQKPERIKILFEKAKAQAPCIVFLDELDVLGSEVIDYKGETNTEKQKILNQLLVELDGFHSFSGVMVIGATHRNSVLDASLTRSGRFGKTIYFRVPSRQDRQEIFEHYCKKIKIKETINYHQLSKLSADFTSADIAMATNEAALIAAKNNKDYVDNNDLVESVNQIFFGVSLNGMPFTVAQKWKTAVHEAGHALVAVKVGKIPQRITIKPHLKFLGAVQLEENEGIHGKSWTQVKKTIEIAIAGLIAEKIIFKEHETGVESDLKIINQFLENAINKSGMSRTLGLMTRASDAPISFKLLEKIEIEKQEIISQAQESVTLWLTENKKQLVDFAKFLYEQRSLDENEMKSWFSRNILNKEAIDDISDIEVLFKEAYK